MNIFVTSDSPRQCAENLDDHRVVRMLLESVQMMATALVECNAPTDALPVSTYGRPYQGSYRNHPANIWVRTARNNYVWLLNHAKALASEYWEMTKHSKMHYCTTQLPRLTMSMVHIPEGQRTPFVNLSSYKSEEIFSAYKKTMIEKWIGDEYMPTWKNRKVPDWVNLEDVLRERRRRDVTV